MNIQTLLIEIDELQKKIEKIEAEKLELEKENEEFKEIIYKIHILTHTAQQIERAIMKLILQEYILEVEKGNFDNFISETKELLIERAYHFKKLGLSKKALESNYVGSFSIIKNYYKALSLDYTEFDKQLNEILS